MFARSLFTMRTLRSWSAMRSGSSLRSRCAIVSLWSWAAAGVGSIDSGYTFLSLGSFRSDSSLRSSWPINLVKTSWCSNWSGWSRWANWSLKSNGSLKSSISFVAIFAILTSGSFWSARSFLSRTSLISRWSGRTDNAWFMLK